MKFIVAGAGLAGLAFAASLRRLAPRHDILILERDSTPDLRGRGYSIGIKGDGAIPVLKALGLYKSLAPDAITVSAFVFADQDGKPLLTLNNTGDERRLTQRVERQKLRAALLGAAGPVRFGAGVVSYANIDKTVRVTLSDGTTETGDILVGADGVNSAIRRQMLGDKPLYRGLSAIVGDAPVEIDHRLLRGGYFMTLGRSGDSVFAYRQRGGVHLSYTSAYADPDLLTDPGAMLENLRLGTASWHAPIPQIVAALRPENLEFRDYYDRNPAEKLRDGRVWLIGDAAHPMVPFQGQGANIGMRDGHELAQFYAAGLLDTAAVEAEFKARGRKAALESRRSAVQFHTRSRFQQAMRNLGFRIADRMIALFSKRPV